MPLTTDPTTWRVLAVDDEVENLIIVTEVLKFFDVDCQAAHGGEQALDVIRRYRPNILLLDLSMPAFSGWRVKDVLRRQAADELRDVPLIIAFTAHAMVGDRERFLEQGFDGYISKPFSLKTFIPAIADVIAKRTPIDPAPDR